MFISGGRNVTLSCTRDKRLTSDKLLTADKHPTLEKLSVQLFASELLARGCYPSGGLSSPTTI
ncbi:Uncharacterised protein [Yersinia enterocolitica]|nr:Uncharacterised protein [Yersinia enterocolitica]